MSDSNRPLTLRQRITESGNVIAALSDWAVNLIEGGQYSFVKLIGAVVPWIATLIPAGLTYVNARFILEWPSAMPLWMVNLLGVASGLSVEGIGIVAMVEFSLNISHQRRMRYEVRLKREREAVSMNGWQVAVPAIVVVAYIAIVTTINVWLHLQPQNVVAQAVTFAGLSLLTVLSAVILAVQATRADLGRLRRSDAGQMRSDEVSSGSYRPYDYRVEVGRLSLQEKLDLYQLGIPEIKRRWPDIHPERPRKWMANLREDLVKGGVISP